MFLNKLIERNPDFLSYAVQLHQEQRIPANSYLLDIDTISNNAKIQAAEGKRLGLKVFPMTKQIGRNPIAIRALAEQGLDSYVVVDMDCARAVNATGYDIGHIGHLVQIPRADTEIAASYHPKYWTVFNLQKAREASDAAGKIGWNQKILARLHAPGDIFYPGHEGGFPADEILKVAKDIDSLDHATFAGITTFPALLLNHDTGEVEPTHNVDTLMEAAKELEKAGWKNLEINAPGTTSTVMMQTLADVGSTQVEPGHGLTGTTPLHALQNLPEDPAALYLTEVSHFYQNKAYCFGGGLYIDPVFPSYDVKALVGKDPDTITEKKLSVEFPPDNAIDYYGMIHQEEERQVQIGDTVIFGFRIQAFVTRAYVVPISGVSKGEPKVEGVYTSEGRKTNWPNW